MYYWNDIQTNKGKIILDAVNYNQNLMKSDIIIPLSISSEKLTYNLDVLQEKIQEVYQEGINTQLNRRRIDGDRIDYTEQAQRLYRLGKLVFDAAVK